MGSQPEIRDLVAGDTERVVEIAVLAWEPVYAEFRRVLGEELFAAGNPNWQEEKARQVRGACEMGPGTGVVVAELDGQVVGFASYHWRDRSGIGEIGNNAVHPDCQGRGIAGRMYEAVFERMRERGMRFAKVGTGLDPSHAPARRAYQKAGFDRELPAVTYYRGL